MNVQRESIYGMRQFILFAEEDIEGLFTWVNQRREINQFGNQNIDQTSGVGDGVLLAKYNFKNVLGRESFVRVGVGTKIPIGSTTKTNENL